MGCASLAEVGGRLWEGELSGVRKSVGLVLGVPGKWDLCTGLFTDRVLCALALAVERGPQRIERRRGMFLVVCGLAYGLRGTGKLSRALRLDVRTVQRCLRELEWNGMVGRSERCGGGGGGREVAWRLVGWG